MKDAGQQQESPTPEHMVRLVEAVARNQDRSAFAQLFAYYAPRVKSYLARSGLAYEVAEEITQEVMITLWQKASYFNPAKAGVSTWVFTIARNRKIDRLRLVRFGSVDADPTDEPDPIPTGETAAMMAERENGVRKALASLSNEQATIVKLSFFAEKPHAEIARELGIPLGTVKSRVRLALGRLRTLLDENL